MQGNCSSTIIEFARICKVSFVWLNDGLGEKDAQPYIDLNSGDPDLGMLALCEIARDFEPFENNISNRILFSRVRLSLSRRQLGEHIDLPGKSIHNFETRSGGVFSKHIFPLADALGVDPRWLATGTGSPKIIGGEHERISPVDRDASLTDVVDVDTNIRPAANKSASIKSDEDSGAISATHGSPVQVEERLLKSIFHCLHMIVAESQRGSISITVNQLVKIAEFVCDPINASHDKKVLAARMLSLIT